MDALLDAAPCGFLTFLDDGRILRVNRTLAEMLGFEASDLQGRHIDEILPPGSRIFYQTHLFPLVRLHERADEIYLTLRRADGGEVGTLLNVRRRIRGGQAENDAAIMRIQERQKFEDELLRARREADRARLAAEEAARAKSDFVTVMSHELRTPLTAVGGYVDLLEQGIYGPVTAKQRDALGRVRGSAKHVLRLINDLLNLSRLEAGSVQFATETVWLGEAARAALTMVEPQAAAKGITLDVDVAPGPAATADREKVEQIVLNLLGNAVKFTPAGGAVRISGRTAQGTVAMTVADTGPGIPPEERERLFGAFVRLPETASGASTEGSGLGLAISRNLARGMGGELTVESESGEGATFVLTLPAAGEPG